MVARYEGGICGPRKEERKGAGMWEKRDVSMWPGVRWRRAIREGLEEVDGVVEVERMRSSERSDWWRVDIAALDDV